jgi:putative tryptophan/tyrosine transport system substrate-binding protein
MIRRREFITLVGGAAAWPLAARAQQPEKTPRVGYLRAGTSNNDPYRESFVRGMHDLGYVEGRAAQAATQSIPIVMGAAADPVGAGLIGSLARPGGNTTGLSILSTELTAKRLELLKEVMPQAGRIAILQQPGNPAHPMFIDEIQSAAKSLTLSYRIFEARRSEDFERSFALMREWPADAVVVLDDPSFIAYRAVMTESAARHRLPLICGFREMTEAGCLFSYAVSLKDMWYRSATYVDKILKGAKPSDLPVQQGTKFEWMINLKTARMLDLSVAPTLLARADEVIE